MKRIGERGIRRGRNVKSRNFQNTVESMNFSPGCCIVVGVLEPDQAKSPTKMPSMHTVLYVDKNNVSRKVVLFYKIIHIQDRVFPEKVIALNLLPY